MGTAKTEKSIEPCLKMKGRRDMIKKLGKKKGNSRRDSVEESGVCK